MNNQASLTVAIYSFSYKHDVPGRDSAHGGGFYFDCRCLPNPGREDAYKSLTGLDEAVIDYLEQQPAVQSFWEAASQLVLQAVEAYTARGFDSLVVGFGCTGGQHRSVYFAERLRGVLREMGVRTTLSHCQAGAWPGANSCA
jgi:RNase adaptor protein for sRNA GlmZ degradation